MRYLFFLLVVGLLSSPAAQASRECDNQGGGSRSSRGWAGKIHRAPRPDRHAFPQAAGDAPPRPTRRPPRLRKP